MLVCDAVRRSVVVVRCVVVVAAQTEGDTGYDYNDAYEDSYDESSGQRIMAPTHEMMFLSRVALQAARYTPS